MRNIQLIKGDCLEEMKKIPDKSVDLILCDLPYGTTACKWDVVIPFEPLWAQYKRIIKDNGATVLFGSEPFSSKLRISSIDTYKYDWVWEKSKATGYLNSKKQPLRAHENILVFYKGQSAYYPQMTDGKPYNKGSALRETMAYGKQREVLVKNDNGLRYPRSVQYFVTAESEGKLHPTQKPVALLEYLIRTYTKEGETVLDNCMGSGSTGVACVNTNRNFIGIELDDHYFEVAQNRIKEAEGQNN